MRIALVESGASSPEKFVYQVYPPTGLMYLASYLREHHSEVEIRIFDLMLTRKKEEEILPEILDFSPQLVGIHSMHFQARSLHQLARLIKERISVPVVVGGPYPSSEPETVLKDTNIDLAVRGEGEITFLEIYQRLKDGGRDFSGIKGCAYRRGEELVMESEREPISDLDQIPFPAWDLIELERFFDFRLLTQNDIRWRKEVATIFTSRACPYGCIFCHNMFGKRFRARSPENVLEEIRLLYQDYGVRELHIIDDCFNFELERAKQILKKIIEQGLDLKLAFPNGIRGDRLDAELVELMKQAGVYKVNFGIESGSERIQKLIRKKLDLEKLKKNIELVARQGIFTHGFFMLGFPTETEEDIKKTIKFALQSKLDTAGFALLSPFPGTRVRKMAEEMGRKVEFAPEDTSYSQLACNLTELSDRRLKFYHRWAHWRFYFRVGQIIRIIRRVPNRWLLPGIFWAHFRLKFL